MTAARTGRRTRIDREQSKALLVQAAIRRLGHDGVDRLRLADVCDDAGKDRSLAGYHFGTKAKLLDVAVQQILAATHHRVFLTPTSYGVAILAESAGAYFAALVADEDCTRALLALARAPRLDAELLRPVTEHRAAIKRLIERHLEGEMAARTLDGAIWMPAVAELLIGGIFGLAIAQLDEPHRDQVAARQVQLVRSIKRMLRGWEEALFRG